MTGQRLPDQIPDDLAKELRRQNSATLSAIADYAEELATDQEGSEKEMKPRQAASIIAMTERKKGLHSR